MHLALCRGTMPQTQAGKKPFRTGGGHQKARLSKLPSSDKLKAELDGLSAHKTALQTELRKIQREEKKYDYVRQNVDMFLT